MSIVRVSVAACLSAVVAGTLLITPSVAKAELLPADQLQGSKMHVVGIYSPKNHGEDDRVFVQVKPTGSPMVVVLTGYFGAQWNVKIQDGADVRQIIVPGYFEHSVVGVPESVPVEYITYFPKNEKSRSDYFWAYSWHSNYGRKLRSSLKEITGLEIATFQGEYSGSTFVIDGKRGDARQFDSESVATDPPPQKNDAFVSGLLKSGMDAKLQRQEMLTRFGKDHPAVKQIEKSIELIQAELSRVGAAPLGNVDRTKSGSSNDSDVGGADQRSIIEKLVRQSFELETQLQVARVEKAEEDLRRVKMQLKQRQDAAEKIIADRVAQLTRKGRSIEPSEATDGTGNESANDLAAEGWAIWRQQKWEDAAAKFESALAKDADNQAARNGLGWSLIHQRKFDSAIEHFKRLLKDAPTHGGALNGLGQALLAQGKLDDAERELLKATEDVIAEHGEEKAVRLGVTASWHGLVRTYMMKGDHERANRWIERYLKYDQNDQIMKELKAQLDSAP